MNVFDMNELILWNKAFFLHCPQKSELWTRDLNNNSALETAHLSLFLSLQEMSSRMLNIWMCLCMWTNNVIQSKYMQKQREKCIDITYRLMLKPSHSHPCTPHIGFRRFYIYRKYWGSSTVDDANSKLYTILLQENKIYTKPVDFKI